jgi:hypothetical protein
MGQQLDFDRAVEAAMHVMDGAPVAYVARHFGLSEARVAALVSGLQRPEVAWAARRLYNAYARPKRAESCGTKLGT